MRRHSTCAALAVLTLFACIVLAPGVSAGEGKAKGSKKAKKFPHVDLSGYSVIYLEDFSLSGREAKNEERKRVEAEAMTRWFPDFVKTEIDQTVFEAVRRGSAKSTEKAVVLRGEILRYKRGSAAARAMMIGTGRAKLSLRVSVVDSATGEKLTSFPIERLWAWGGILGASRGMDEIQQNVGRQLARYLEQCKQVTTVSNR